MVATGCTRKCGCCTIETVSSLSLSKSHVVGQFALAAHQCQSILLDLPRRQLPAGSPGALEQRFGIIQRNAWSNISRYKVTASLPHRRRSIYTLPSSVVLLLAALHHGESLPDRGAGGHGLCGKVGHASHRSDSPVRGEPL